MIKKTLFFLVYSAIMIGSLAFVTQAKADFSEPGIIHLNTQTGEMSFCAFKEELNFSEIICVQMPVEIVQKVSEQCAMDIQSSLLLCGKDLEKMSF